MENIMSEVKPQHGFFNWNELMTTDVEAAKKFYGALAGWTFEKMDNPEMDYYCAKSGETMTAGIMGQPKEAQAMPPMWGGYITVDNVDESAAQAEALGGKVIIPLTDIPTVGRFCVILDPQGAAVSLITYSEEGCA